MSDAPKRLFLLDALALIYRAHFAFTKTPRINSKGRNTSVPFGFTNTLLEVLTRQKPTHIAVAFDTSAPTFRDEIFKEYKATRQETPEDIRYGMPKVKEIIRGFNIPILEMDGFEADDIIGTLAKRAEKQGYEVYMMTPDKDFGQLVSEKVLLYKPAYMGNAVDVLGVKEVCEKWDIKNVEQVTDMLGLQGDTSDNIPGIPGVGPKTASALIRQYGSVEEVVAHAGDLKGKQRELVEKFGEQAILSKQLATINTEVPVTFSEEALAYKGPDIAKLKPIFEELEFKTILSRVMGQPQAMSAPASSPKGSQLSMFGPGSRTEESAEATAEIAPGEKKNFYSKLKNYFELEDPGEIKELCGYLLKQKEFAVEPSLEEVNGEWSVKGIAFSYHPDDGYYIRLASEPDARKNLELLKDALVNPSIRKSGHDLKALWLALKPFGIELTGPLFDSMLAHYLIEPEAAHDIGTLSSFYLGYQLLTTDDTRPERDRRCEVADMVFQLRPVLEKELERRKQLKLLSDVELPLLEVLGSMEWEGVKVDLNFLSAMSEELKKESEKIQQAIFKLSGQEFNLNSPKQLGEILFEKLKLGEGKIKKTKTGQYATGEEVLQKLAAENEIARKILDFREYDKLRSTYVDALPKMISSRDGHIHTDYRQAVAATGRLSSNNPNLQNIPIRTEKGRQIRRAFIPRNNDYLFMSADYSQIELRIAASFAKDQTMIEAFRAGRDIHTTTAAKVFKVPVEQVTADMRRKAKEVNFGILYGSTAFGLSQNLNIARTEAAEIIESYFREFAAIKRYMDNSILEAREKEYVETLMGRRRWLRDINSRNLATRGFAERNAINAPIQGSAADIIKVAMINIHRWLKQGKLKTKMILQVHDELVFDLHRSEQEAVKENVTRLMKSAVQLEVPMEVEVGVGENWLEAH
jgi:DNA polymerase-1